MNNEIFVKTHILLYMVYTYIYIYILYNILLIIMLYLDINTEACTI